MTGLVSFLLEYPTASIALAWGARGISFYFFNFCLGALVTLRGNNLHRWGRDGFERDQRTEDDPAEEEDPPPPAEP